MKEFFKIEEKYKFEYNDLRALITVINVILIMRFGLKISWFGFSTACLGLLKNIKGDRHINGLVMYIANIILNGYFLLLYYL